jgi:hypothetical protein
VSSVTATVTSQPIKVTASGASVSATVTSSSSSVSASGGVGPQGVAGPVGAAGATGPANTLSIGTVVGGTSASATLTGAAPSQVLNLVLPKGDTGSTGPQGEAGATGSAGAAGPANTLTIGTVTSGPSASATITGSSPSQVLSLVLPKGDTGSAGAAGATGSQGAQGVAGSTGPAGPANSLSIGTVSEGEVGATITGTAPSQVLNLVLPRGNTGPSGAAGATGSQGIQGVAGSTGPAGPANTLSIGTVSSGATAAATITGASPSQTLNLVLPKGDTGSQGVAGATGPQGPQASLVYASISDFPATGSSTALYLAEDTSRLYQWESPVYVEVGTSGGGIATTSASDLTSGTLPDARLSGNVLFASALAARQHQATSFIDAVDRNFINTTAVPVNNAIYLTFFTPAYTLTITQIAFACTTAASGVTLCRYGLYTADASGNATLVARTASDTTIFNSSNSVFTRSLDSSTGGYPSSYTLNAGTRYAVALCIAATNTGSVSGALIPHVISALSPRVQGVRTGANEILTTQGSGQYNGSVGHAYWARLS